ncbi:MAG: hypothetical protein Q9P01_12270 [Anaerolineae bacterium]|nr:hypothetical protein [Anaerolineae bacterium]MDQ7035574.1 hypothetical protein [Anaerolineae bacterium]
MTKKYINRGGNIGLEDLSPEEKAQLDERQTNPPLIPPTLAERVEALENMVLGLVLSRLDGIEVFIRQLWMMQRISTNDIDALVQSNTLTRAQANAILALQ